MGPDQEELSPDEAFLEAGLTEISSDLFGEAGSDVGEVETEEAAVEGEGQEAAAVGPSDVPPPDPGEGEPAPVETETVADAPVAPKTWSKEAAADWATIPPKIQAEILKREEDMFRGLEQYKERATLGTAYDAVVEPYRGALAAENINPVELFKAFAGNHYILSRGSPEQKVQVAAQVLEGYGIDLNAVAAHATIQQHVDPEIAQLRQELAAIKGSFTQSQEAEQASRLAEKQREVEAFASDPANIYFEEVSADIAALLKAGVAKTLPEAYDRAVYANPVTRQKEMARQQQDQIAAKTQEAAAKAAKVNKATSVNIDATPKAKDGTIPVGTMDDTLAETFARLNAS